MGQYSSELLASLSSELLASLSSGPIVTEFYPKSEKISDSGINVKFWK